jgi:ankyrin repeat protein
MGCGASTKKASEPAPVVVVQKSAGPPEVPPRKLMALKEAFGAIDDNNTGSIDSSELKDLLSRVGYDDFSEEDRTQLLQSMDKNGDSKIEFGEFVGWVLTHEGNSDAINDSITEWALKKGLGDLHNAAISGDPAKIIAFLDASKEVGKKRGSLVNAGDVTNVTPLHYACRVGNLDCAKCLLKEGADIAARTSDTKRQPLHAAAENGSAEVVRLLLENKAEINATDGRTRTPLHWAVCSSKEEAATELLKAKADVNAKSSAGYTPLAMAQDWSTYQMVELIKANGGAMPS